MACMLRYGGLWNGVFNQVAEFMTCHEESKDPERVHLRACLRGEDMSHKKIFGQGRMIKNLKDKNDALLEATGDMASKLEYLLNKYHITADQFEAEYRAAQAQPEEPPQADRRE